ncbi:MAG: hypothetical protein WCX73_05400, partial [Candidatus Pacearchaeota archaeon]
YINNISRTNAIQISSSGNWVSQAYTVDAGLHQFDGNTFYYYMCANDTAKNIHCSSIRYDKLELAGLSPNVYIFSPEGQIYRENINLNYYAESPNSYNIVNYTISLLNSTSDYNSTLVANTTNISYVWDSTSVRDSQYIISIQAYDNMSQSSITYSENFTIDNTDPLINLTSITTTAGSQTISFNYTASDAHLDHCKFSITNASGSIDGIYNNVSIASCTAGSAVVSSFGTYNLIVYAIDSAGNYNTSTQNFTISLVAGGGGFTSNSHLNASLFNETQEKLLAAEKVCNIQSINNIRNCLILLIDSSFQNWIVFVIIICSIIILTEYYNVGISRIFFGKRKKESLENKYE